MTSSSFKKSDNIEKQLITGSQIALQNNSDYKQEILEPIKTSSNNYKSNINQRIVEDIEPDKPIINYKKQQEETQQEEKKQSSPKKQLRATGEISDQRLEEIKIEHYNRKMNMSKDGNAFKETEKQVKVVKSDMQNKRNSQANRQSKNIPEKQVVLDNYSHALQQQQVL